MGHAVSDPDSGMKPIRELADKIAAAVVACVNGDLENYDMLVLNNIEQVIEAALILHGRPGVETSTAAKSHLQVLQLVAEARLCCDAFLLGADSLLIRQTLPAALAELTALKRMAERSADAMMALQAALRSDTGQPVKPSSDDLETAVKALEFYAEGDNHKSTGGNPSAVARDRGRTAREALETLSGETDDNSEHEGEEEE